MKQLIFVFLLFCVLSNLVRAVEPDKNKMYDMLIKKYGKINTIWVVSESEDNLSENYNIKAKKGNKYHITTGQTIVVTNGTTIWTYNPTMKTVVISNYDNDVENITLDNIFFDVMPNLQPISLKTILSNKNKKQYLLELQNKDKKQDIKQVNLYINDKRDKIENIEIVTADANNSLKWKINKLEINKTIDDSIFNFKIPKNTEEIDMR